MCPRILIVDDVEKWRDQLEDVFFILKFKIDKVGNFEEANRFLLSSSYDIILIDIDLDQTPSYLTFQKICSLSQKEQPDASIVATSGKHIDPEFMFELSNCGVVEFVAKSGLIVDKFRKKITKLIPNYECKKKGRVFIGHGRSLIWQTLRDYISNDLGLRWDEFNRESVAGLTTNERLSQMLNDAIFAFLIMTAEDEHFDSTLHARPNVIHEIGLFQERLGQKKAIVLIEEGCAEFSNISGLSQIRFPKEKISSIFDDIQQVLKREGILPTRK